MEPIHHSPADAASVLCALGARPSSSSVLGARPSSSSAARPTPAQIRATAAAASCALLAAGHTIARYASDGAAGAEGGAPSTRMEDCLVDTPEVSRFWRSKAEVMPPLLCAGGIAPPEPKRRRSERGQPKQGWTRQEDSTILTMVQQCGCKWSLIAAQLYNRTGAHTDGSTWSPSTASA